MSDHRKTYNIKLVNSTYYIEKWKISAGTAKTSANDCAAT